MYHPEALGKPLPSPSRLLEALTLVGPCALLHLQRASAPPPNHCQAPFLWSQPLPSLCPQEEFGAWLRFGCTGSGAKFLQRVGGRGKNTGETEMLRGTLERGTHPCCPWPSNHSPTLVRCLSGAPMRPDGLPALWVRIPEYQPPRSAVNGLPSSHRLGLAWPPPDPHLSDHGAWDYLSAHRQCRRGMRK